MRSKGVVSSLAGFMEQVDPVAEVGRVGLHYRSVQEWGLEAIADSRPCVRSRTFHRLSWPATVAWTGMSVLTKIGAFMLVLGQGQRRLLASSRSCPQPSPNRTGFRTTSRL